MQRGRRIRPLQQHDPSGAGRCRPCVYRLVEAGTGPRASLTSNMVAEPCIAGASRTHRRGDSRSWLPPAWRPGRATATARFTSSEAALADKPTGQVHEGLAHFGAALCPRPEPCSVARHEPARKMVERAVPPVQPPRCGHPAGRIPQALTPAPSSNPDAGLGVRGSRIPRPARAQTKGMSVSTAMAVRRLV